MLIDIHLDKVLPKVFCGQLPEAKPSDVWLQDITFHRGTSYLIEAASGRGKSSLCAYLYGMRQDYDGSISWRTDDESACSIQDTSTRLLLRQRGLSMMFQDLRLFAELTAVENVLLKNRLTDFLTEAEIRQKLCRLGLSDRLDVPCGRLSIGQQQRVAFVRMLCQPADFCLLDEPVSHLDEANSQVMSEMLTEHQQVVGCGVIVTSIGHRLPYSYTHSLSL